MHFCIRMFSHNMIYELVLKRCPGLLPGTPNPFLSHTYCRRSCLKYWCLFYLFIRSRCLRYWLWSCSLTGHWQIGEWHQSSNSGRERTYFPKFCTTPSYFYPNAKASVDDGGISTCFSIRPTSWIQVLQSNERAESSRGNNNNQLLKTSVLFPW